MRSTITWPEGKRFAFTIFDDADEDRFSNTKPVYDFLAELGFRTTKSCWLEAGEPDQPLGGECCENLDYLKWLIDLQEQGFEIGWHNARDSSSTREVTDRCLRRFKLYFGYSPKTMSNHLNNQENLYWGADRLDHIYRWIYRLGNFRAVMRDSFEGHNDLSPYFWGDLCRRNVQYCRNFVFPQMNTLKCCPSMPYHDERRPFVPWWYASSEGNSVGEFVHTIREEEQDRLEEEGGACIMYAHLAKDFHSNGRLNDRFESLIRRLAAKGGWYVPVGVLLDFLKSQPGGGEDLNSKERNRLQLAWLKTKLLKGAT